MARNRQDELFFQQMDANYYYDNDGQNAVPDHAINDGNRMLSATLAENTTKNCLKI